MLKIGTFKHKIPKNTQLHVEGQSEFAIVEIIDGKPSHMVARSKDRECKFTIRKDSELSFQIDPKKFISVDARPVPGINEDVSDIPYEIPDDNQANLSLEEKLKYYLQQMVMEKYGPESAEFDTFEETMDFDEEDENILSGFEVPEFQEEELNVETIPTTNQDPIPLGTSEGTPTETKENTEATTESTATT